MAANCAIYRDQAAALAAYAEPGVKVGAGGSRLNHQECIAQFWVAFSIGAGLV
jgi:hypothetical protein